MGKTRLSFIKRSLSFATLASSLALIASAIDDMPKTQRQLIASTVCKSEADPDICITNIMRESDSFDHLYTMTRNGILNDLV